MPTKLVLVPAWRSGFVLPEPALCRFSTPLHRSLKAGTAGFSRLAPRGSPVVKAIFIGTVSESEDQKVPFVDILVIGHCDEIGQVFPVGDLFELCLQSFSCHFNKY